MQNKNQTIRIHFIGIGGIGMSGIAELMKKIGYTTGVFDLFHIGHLNILKRARLECDHLIVGVTTDELAEKAKSQKPFIPFQERMPNLKNQKKKI